MTNNNLTDAEIIKALEWHLNDEKICYGCPLVTIKDSTTYCVDMIMKNALDLINRQKAKIKELSNNFNTQGNVCENLLEENANLKAEIERLKASLNIKLENYATEYDNKIKAEAYKECIEKVKKLMEGWGNLKYYRDFIKAYTDLDNLLKEFGGEDNASKN